MRLIFSKNGFSKIAILIVVVILAVVAGLVYYLMGSRNLNVDKSQINYSDNDKGHGVAYQAGEQTNSYLQVPCISNPKVSFTHDFTDVDMIKSVEPTIITPGSSRHRAWLNISSGKVPVYAPVDSELVNGVYKNARGALDYDLHFQVSCEIWYLINHVTEPVDKIINLFPDTPQTDTRTNPPFKEPLKVKAGELLGYSTGTPVAHNFDFGVFDLNNFNEGLPGDEGLKYGKEANFICPFDVLPDELRKKYYSKIISSEKPYTNCKE